MSTKTTTQHTRRAPLSLSGGGKQQSQNNHSGKSADSNGNSNNSASAKNDNKHSASQKTELNVNDAKESTPKDLKKAQNVEKKPPQQTANNETVKKNEKIDEKKTQNGNGKAAANGGAKEKHQNGSDKQDNNGNSSNTKANTTSSNAKTTTSNSNGNSNVKSNVKSSEKTATAAVVKEDTKTKEQKPAEPVEKSAKDSVKEKEKETEKEKEKEKEKKKENEQEKVVEKETRSRRQEVSAAAEPEKKQLDKIEPTKSDETKTEVSTPTSRSSAAQAKSRTTPTTGVEKSGRSTPTKPVEKPSTPSTRNKTVTTVIDDVEMEPLTVESSPAKSKENTIPVTVATAAPVLQPPAATSTPDKAPLVTLRTKTHNVDVKSDHAINALSSGNSPDRKSVPRTFNHIGGRRSIRPLTEYTPSKFQSNLPFRESYRRINTELDVSSTTNTSMNVTVGSEVPNNSSFSFFGRGRKRDRTPPPQSQSAMELQTDADYSPPKRARYDMYSLFSVVSSPLTMLRSRFSRASIQSSTPMKLTSKLAAADEDEADVQNVSGISIEEGNATDAAESDEKTATEDITVGKNTDEDTTPKMDTSPMKVDEKCGMEKGDEVNDELDVSKSSNVHEVAAGIADTSVSSAKNKRCNIM
ncbi:general transcriptional corepressor trfA [Zeugodacus cucurbitae]|uniref:general transcriptional corepressor trfA n=1 Tax=Zeugodacus cucurbitae TaxID=28588 RepID=UPI0023D90C83|nr:general transcriptional corepressor trfA [Zeugodacus cucurbitae]XP_011184719.2 general transcriptional corepressor trfA [Zeugodacus cucurbitae]